MSLSAARRFADAPFAFMLASTEKLRAALDVITRQGIPQHSAFDVERIKRLTAALDNR
jgi:hypothetical protein